MFVCWLFFRGLTTKETACLLENVYVSPSEVVPFRAFRGGLFCCLAYKEFVKQIKELFGILVDAEVRPSPSKSIHFVKVHEIIEKISDVRNLAFATVTKRKRGSKVDWSTFIDAASEVFWTKMMTCCLNDSN